MASQLAKRADAARNVERILEAAIHVLALDPGAGMTEVAARAGLGRATLYRHFPTRDDLLAAIRAKARQEALEVVQRCPPDEGSALDCIESIVRAVIELGDRYRFLSGWRAEAESHPEAGEQISAVLRAAVERGQRRGEITRSVSPEWAATAIRSLMLAAIDELASGRVTDREAARLTTRVVLHGLGPARRRSAA